MRIIFLLGMACLVTALHSEDGIALCFLIFQPVSVLSEGVKVHFSLSQMSLFLNKMDDFLASKCIMNKSAFNEMSEDEKSNWKDELEQSIPELKCSELRTLVSQIDIKIDPMEIDDQQQPSTMSAKAFMEMLLNKMLEKLPEKLPEELPKPKRHRFNVEKNVFAGDEFVNLNPEQNQLLLYELFKISSDFAEKFLKITRNENELSKFGDNCSLINWAFYEELEWKLKKVVKIIKDLDFSSTSWFFLYKYFIVNISWHEPDENITAWKLDVPMLNEQRFVQSLLNYCSGFNKMEMLLKNGFKDFLTTFQKKEKSWKIVMPSAIKKMKDEIDKQIQRLNEEFTLSLNSVEQNRLFLISMYRIALHFVQNLLVNGLLNDGKINALVFDIKKKMNNIFFRTDMSYDENFGMVGQEIGEKLESNKERKERKEKNLKKYFEGIEQYYYGNETCKKLKEILGKFKNEQKNPNHHVSIGQVGSDNLVLANFIETKLTDSIGDLLREGESLALLDWCHKNRRQISMTEMAYIVEKLRKLLFPDVQIVEWEREEERELSVDLNQLKNRLDKMPFDQILPKVVGEKFGKFLHKLFDGFNFIASSHLGINELDRKLIFCYELSKFAYELLKKSLHEFNQNEDDDSIQRKLIHIKFYKNLVKDFYNFNEDASSELQKTTNVFVKLRSNWTYFQADFKYENVIASELRMEFPIELKEFGQIIKNIGHFIFESCGKKHLWNLVDNMDELNNCSNRLDFAKFGRSFGTIRSFKLANLVVNVLKCEAANGADKWTCSYNDQIFEQITEVENKRFVLKGLLEFGRLVMEKVGIFALGKRALVNWRTMLWKNIAITFTAYETRLAEEMEAMKNALKEAGLIKAMGDEILKNRDSLLAKAKAGD